MQPFNTPTPEKSVKYTNSILIVILIVTVFVFAMACIGTWVTCGQIKKYWQESHKTINLHAIQRGEQNVIVCDHRGGDGCRVLLDTTNWNADHSEIK